MFTPEAPGHSFLRKSPEIRYISSFLVDLEKKYFFFEFEIFKGTLAQKKSWKCPRKLQKQQNEFILKIINICFFYIYN